MGGKSESHEEEDMQEKWEEQKEEAAEGTADICPMINVQVITMGGTTIDLKVSLDSTLSSFKEMVQEQTSIPKVAQMLFFEGQQLPSDHSGEATLDSFGIGTGAQLTVVRLRAPGGIWTGTYQSRPSSPYKYDMAFDCDKWIWLGDGARKNLQFEIQYRVVKHPVPDAVGVVAVEVYQVDFNWSESSLKGFGIRTYKKNGEGPPVNVIIGRTPMLNLAFDGDVATGSTNETTRAFELKPAEAMPW